ncbi:MAG TPA: hypothetical protein VKJ00_03965 [Thermoanaerobaculia bacterium]|nr:hypothetical protein [Thermoanaerobaculia bacterium]
MSSSRIFLAVSLGIGLAARARGGVGEWTNRGLPAVAIQSVAADPGDPDVVYAAGATGTYKSADGAAIWTRVMGGTAALAIDPKRPATLYAGGPNLTRSLDAGVTWTSSATGLTCPFVTALAIDPEIPATLFAGASDLAHEPSQCGGLFRSRDFGATWTALSPDFIAHGGLAIDPRNPARIFAIEYDEFGNSLHRSEDGGESWAPASLGLLDPLAIAPDPTLADRVYVAAIDGVYVSEDAGVSFRRSGLEGLIVTTVLVDPRVSDLLYAGTLAHGVYRSLDGGQSWSTFNSGLTDLSVSALALSASGARIYAGTNTGGVFDFEFVARAPVTPGAGRPATRLLGPRP